MKNESKIADEENRKDTVAVLCLYGTTRDVILKIGKSLILSKGKFSMKLFLKVNKWNRKYAMFIY